MHILSTRMGLIRTASRLTCATRWRRKSAPISRSGRGDWPKQVEPADRVRPRFTRARRNGGVE